MAATRGGALALAAFVAHVAAVVLAGPGSLTIVSAAVLAAVLTGLVIATVVGNARIARTVTAAPLRRRAAILQEKSWSVAFLQQRDPDAAGRPRPRAPSVAPAA